MTEERFDIFLGNPDDGPLWLETASGLSKARERMGQIAAERPGRYFLFSLQSHTVFAQIETFKN
jgi:hypothetical protein